MKLRGLMKGHVFTIVLAVAGLGLGDPIQSDATTIISDHSTSCQFGNALQFDGIGDSLVLPLAALNNMPTGTVEAWVKFTNINASPCSEAFIVDRSWRSPSYSGDLRLAKERAVPTIPANGHKFYFSLDNGNNRLYSTTVAQQNVWYHVAGSWDGVSWKIYVNGVLENTRSDVSIKSLPNRTTGKVYLGKIVGSGPSGECIINGLIDEIRFSDVARISSDFCRFAPCNLDGSTRGLWHLDESSGSAALDETTNHYNGSVYGAVFGICSGSGEFAGRVRIENVAVQHDGQLTNYLPFELPEIMKGDYISFTGQVLDKLLNPIPNKIVRIYDPIRGNLETGDSCIFQATTDDQGRFRYPDLGNYPNGLICDSANLFGIWFSADNSAIPMIVQVSEACGGHDCLLDTIQAWVQQSNFPVGTIVAIPDTGNPLLLRFPAYPPNDASLVDPVNNDFFEGYAWSYKGDTTASFLRNPDSGWLVRGIALYEARVDSILKTFRTYTQGAGSGSNFIVLANKTASGWSVSQNLAAAPRTKLTNWELAVYGLQAGVCLGGVLGFIPSGGLSGVLIVGACTGLFVQFAAETVIKPTAKNIFCKDEVYVEDDTPCKSGVSAGVDGSLILLTWWRLGTPQLARYGSLILNPRNLKGGATVATLLLASDIADVGGFVYSAWDFTDALSTYYLNPISGSTHAFGFGNLQYANLTNQYLAAQRMQAIATMRGRPKLTVTSSFDNASNPTYVDISVIPTRPLFAQGTTNVIPPEMTIYQGTTSTPLAFTTVDNTNFLYQAHVPVNQLPQYIPGEPYRAEIRTSGADLVSNQGAKTAVCSRDICSSSGLTIKSEIGEGIEIPANACSNPTWVSVNSCDLPNYPMYRGQLGLAATISGQAYHITPDSLSLMAPAVVAIQIDSSAFDKLNQGGYQCFMARYDQDSLKWHRLVATVDATTGIVSSNTNRLGIFVPVLDSSCCTFNSVLGRGGNVDCDPQKSIDIADLARLIDFLYISFTPLCCATAANVDGDPAGAIDISDLAVLIDYLYISFTPTAACQ